MYLGLIIEFTGNMNHVVVLICTMIPRAWSWASSAVAPGQLFGTWALYSFVKEYKVAQPLWKTIHKFLKKLAIELLCPNGKEGTIGATE